MAARYRLLTPLLLGFSLVLIREAMALRVPPDRTGHGFVVTRILSCERIEEGEPVGISESFDIETPSIAIYFEGYSALSPTSVTSRWFVNGVAQLEASDRLVMPPGERRGVFGVNASAGQSLKPGQYRVELYSGGHMVATHALQITPASVQP
jgi:hypothetical protein